MKPQKPRRAYKVVTMDRVCGNCVDHEAYEYPSKVFCTSRFLSHKDPVKRTMDTCEEWSEKRQECNCVEDCKKNLNPGSPRGLARSQIERQC